MGKKEVIDGYFLDDEGYYVTNKIFRERVKLKKCPQCKNYLYYVYAEKYLLFCDDILMIMGIKIYGHECDFCNCGFIYDGE